jgi:hypothetical protein
VWEILAWLKLNGRKKPHAKSLAGYHPLYRTDHNAICAIWSRSSARRVSARQTPMEGRGPQTQSPWRQSMLIIARTPIFHSSARGLFSWCIAVAFLVSIFGRDDQLWRRWSCRLMAHSWHPHHRVVSSGEVRPYDGAVRRQAARKKVALAPSAKLTPSYDKRDQIR